MKNLALACTLVAAVACTGTETGNPARPEVSVALRSSDEAVASVGAGDAVVVDEAWAALEDVTFWPTGGCDDAAASEVAVMGPLVVDLAVGAPYQEWDASRDAYCQVTTRLHSAPSLPSGAPSELEGRTLVVRGSRADGTPFVLVSDAIVTLGSRGAGDTFEVTEARANLLLALDVATWFTGVDLSGATVDAGGVIVIDDASNADLLAAVEANLSSSADLFHDADGDRHVDDGEELLAPHH